MALNVTNLGRNADRLGNQRISDMNAAAREGARDHRAGSFGGKNTINGEAWFGRVLLRLAALKVLSDRVLELIDALACDGGDGYDRRFSNRGVLKFVAQHFHAEGHIFTEVSFGESNDDIGNAEIGKNM